MATILVIQHGLAQGTGRLGATLRDHGFRLDIRRVHASPGEGGDPLPADLSNVHGIVSLGGPQNVDESHWWITRELELIRAAHARNLPVVGLCLGHQLIATALGGKIERLPQPEIGFHRLSLTIPGQTETMLAGVPWDTDVFFSHAYAVTTPPPGAVVLAASERSRVGIFRVGMRTYGFQHHLEADQPMIEAISGEASGLMGLAGLSAAALGAQVDQHYAMFARASDRICVNLATYAFPYHELLAV